MDREVGTWIICPECRSRSEVVIPSGRMVSLKCGVCRRQFRAYEGKAWLFWRSRRTDGWRYFILVYGRGVLPRPFWFSDAKDDEVVIYRGDRVVLVFDRSAPSVVEDISLATFWTIYKAVF